MNQNQLMQTKLQETYRIYAEARGQRNRNVRLPSALGIETTVVGLRLRLDAKSVVANMQTDAAAFEGWALVLRLWLGEKHVPHIELDWEGPGGSHNGHYERFLYRVAQFGSSFPSGSVRQTRGDSQPAGRSPNHRRY